MKKSNKYIPLKSTILCALPFFLLGQICRAQKLVKIQPVMSNQQLKHLSAKLSKSDVLISRQGIAKKPYRFVKMRQEHGQGVSLSPNLFLTTSSWLKLRPDEAKFIINLSCPHAFANNSQQGQNSYNQVKAEMIQFSDSEGWALLKSKQATYCRGIELKYLSQSFLESSFYIGSRVYIYEPKPLLPAQLTILGQAEAPMHYFWYSTGQIKVGSALYNYEGKLVSLSASTNSRTFPFKTLILPPSAILDALNKAKEILK